MTLTEQQIKIISEHPLHDTLDLFRHKLHGRLVLADPEREDVASLLSALVGSPAALSLPSPDGSGNVAVKLFSIQQHVQGGIVNLNPFSALVRHVIDKSSDNVIWAAVFDLFDILGLLTPSPSSIAPTFKGTPVRTSSSRLADSETSDVIERELFEEIQNCTFRKVGEFCNKFFDTKNWRTEQNEMLEALKTEHDGKKWVGFPSIPDEKPVWAWLRSLEERALADAPHKLYTTQTASQFEERKGQMDLFFQIPSATPGRTFKYKHVLVVGEQKKSYDTSRFKADLLQLTRYVRGVFADQPTRRFVHGFTLCASMMELWVFDRSGAYSSGPFDIHDKPDTFARALVGYATMDDDAMGLDTFIDREDGHRYVALDDTNGNETRIELARPIVRQKAVVCRGTTCFETRTNHVANLSRASLNGSDDVHLESGEVGIGSFPFLHLPPELRMRIWEQFCPDLAGRPRILEFDIELVYHADGPLSHPANRAVSDIYPGGILEEQTMQSRRVLAVHRESRALALAALPHSLCKGSSQRGMIIRFNKDLDIIMLHVFSSNLLVGDEPPGGIIGNSLPGFQDHVVNLAVSRQEFKLARDRFTMEPWLRSFPQMKRLFFFASAAVWEDRRPKNEDDRCCMLPDLLRQEEFDAKQVLGWYNSRLRTIERELIEHCHIQTWPMVLLNCDIMLG